MTRTIEWWIFFCCSINKSLDKTKRYTILFHRIIKFFLFTALRGTESNAVELGFNIKPFSRRLTSK